MGLAKHVAWAVDWRLFVACLPERLQTGSRSTDDTALGGRHRLGSPVGWFAIRLGQAIRRQRHRALA